MKDDGECGAVGGMTGKGKRCTRRKPAPLSLSPPQIPQYLIRAAAVGSRRLTELSTRNLLAEKGDRPEYKAANLNITREPTF
jgi:hypothetical protein